MPFFTLFTKPAMRRMRTYRVGLAFAGIGLLLSGCGNSTDFVHEPPASYRVPAAAELHGVWAREGEDNGERVRVSGLADGTVRFDFFQTRPSADPMPSDPLIARVLRFDDQDWLLLDLRKLSTLLGNEYSGNAPYKLIRYAMKGTDRVCGIEPSAAVLAEGVASGELQGTVDKSFKPWTRVAVTSIGEDWVNWWTALPASRKSPASPAPCFQRAD